MALVTGRYHGQSQRRLADRWATLPNFFFLFSEFRQPEMCCCWRIKKKSKTKMISCFNCCVLLLLTKLKIIAMIIEKKMAGESGQGQKEHLKLQRSQRHLHNASRFTFF